jgi:gas vesicle protein
MRGLMNGVIFGGLAAFLFDPVSGNRRRALIRDKMIHYNNMLCEFTDKQIRDKRNRLEGVKHEMRSVIDKGRSMIEKNQGGINRQSA